MDRTCPGCSVSIAHKAKTAKWCSEACRSWINNGHPLVSRPGTTTCVHCETVFIATSLSVRYCSPLCRSREYAQRSNRDPVVYYALHRAVMLQRTAAYDKANPERRKATNQRRRARKLAAPTFEVTGRDWKRAMARTGGCCFYCGERKRLTVDHVLPLSQGGAHSVGNIVPACMSCNCSKRERTVMEWRMRSKRPRLLAA